MEIVVPDYMKAFHCIAEKCPDSCCRGWAIVIDDDTLKKYRRYPGAFGNRLRNSIDWKEKCYLKSKGKCAFYNEQGLCDIHAEAGEEYLCKTCSRYPKHIEEFENIREKSLSISCPEAARIILSNTKKVEYEVFCTEISEEYQDFDYMLFSGLSDARRLMIRIMQSRKQDIRLRMAMVLSLGHDIEIRIRKNHIADIENVIVGYGAQKELPFDRFKAVLEKKCDFSMPFDIAKLFEEMSKFEVLSDYWPELVSALKEQLHTRAKDVLLWNCFSCADKHIAEVEKQVQISQNGHKTDMLLTAERMSIVLEQLMVYFIFVYYVGAVYDRKAFQKLKACCYSVMVIWIMLLLRFETKGKLTMEDCIEITYKYSREIEHSDFNLDRLENIMQDYRLKDMLKILYSI